MKLQHASARLWFVFASLLCCAAPAAAQWGEWKPVDPAQLALKAPVVEKDADAEALLWEVYVNDANTDTEYLHFVRIKIFSERGKEAQGKVDISYFNNVQIKDIAARTIKPDGTITELKKDAVFEREIVRFNKFKLRAKTIALPAIEVGAIIEYRWREVHVNQIADNVPIQMQREIPVHVMRCYLKPYQYTTEPMRTISFNTNQQAQFAKDKNGYYKLELTNMPAFRAEPYMPPEDQVRAWTLVYYEMNRKQAPQQYWQERGKRLHEVMKPYLKVNDDVRRAAAEAVGDATAPEQKLERLFNYCRTKIKDITDDASGLTAEQLKKMKDNNSPGDTLKRGYGTGTDIDFLFAALAQAAGFDARYVSLSDRSRYFFNANTMNPYFLRGYNIAVKVGADWRFFDPASRYVPFGMLRWQEEGIQALVTDPKEAAFVPTPLSAPDKSQQKRVAKLRLSEDGTLSGTVQITYTGHAAVEQKEAYDDKTPQERQQRLTNNVKARLSTAELTEVKLESAADPVKPFSYSYKISVPGYAERTGKRLFLQPAFFQRNIAPFFGSNTRQHDVYFNYAWLEHDHIEIELPPGYALDNADAPGSFTIGELGDYKVVLGMTKDQKILVYERTFRFSGMLFPKKSYSQLKQAFDAIHQQDNHAITLKQGATAAKQ